MKALSVLTILYAATALAGCKQFAAPVYDYETPVKAELRDPGSAQFSDVEVTGTVACGFVNSKNGFGGYAGKVPFVVRDQMATVIEEASKQNAALVYAACPPSAAAKISTWLTEAAVRRLNATL